MNPSWFITGSLVHISRQLNHFHDFKEEGWYSRGGDWLLIREIIPGLFECLCWNNQDPRIEMRRMLDLPVLEKK